MMKRSFVISAACACFFVIFSTHFSFAQWRTDGTVPDFGSPGSGGWWDYGTYGSPYSDPYGSPYATPFVPTAPTNVRPQGTLACGTTSVTLSWSAVSGASGYAPRADDGINSPRAPGYPTDCGPHYLCVNNHPTTSLTLTTIPGRTYNVWVHARTSSGTFSPASASSVFT
jgi:hypothetical protein